MTDTAIRWRDEPARLELLDQRRLPHETVWIGLDTPAQVADAIRQMVVRGAPAIGIAAAYGVALGALTGEDASQARAVLAASRPTAVNLHWALARLKAMQDLGATPQALLAEAKAIHAEDFRQNRAIGELGASLLPADAVVLTHCNTGALATGGHGTALGVIRSAFAAGHLAMVYHTETRPWMQGARLTAWELKTAGIPARLLADAAGAQLMASTRVDWLIVGADRIAANGDTANKIGTYTLALCARALGVKVMVAAPTGTFDLSIDSGAQIPIEERDGAELLSWQGARVAPDGHEAWNPVFDVTPAGLVDAIVCERGVIERPTPETVRAVLARPFP